MLTFIIPLLLGSIIGFLIRGKPSDTFAITTGRRVAWAIGFGFGGLLIGMPIGLAISPTTGPQIAGLIATGVWLGVFNILSIENATYNKWSERKVFAWVCGAIVALPLLAGFLPNEIRGIFPRYERDSVTKSAVPSVALGGKDAEAAELPNTYLGVTLGDSEQQVRYALGEPSKKKQNDGELIFIYKGDYGIWFSPNRAVRSIACQSIDVCPEFAGIKIGDEEAKVKAILGKNASETFQEVTDASGNYLMKVITLSREKRVRIFLKKQKVIAISLSEPTERD